MQQKKHPSLVINAFSNWAALGVSIVFGLFLTPFIIKNLGKTGYGIWTLISTIIGYYGILDLGVSSAITRYVARYVGQKDHDALNETINTALMMFSVVGMIVIVSCFTLATPLASFFNVSRQNAKEFKDVTYLLGLVAGIGFSSNVFSAVICAHEKFVIDNFIKIIITTARAIIIYFFLSHGFGLPGIGWAYLLTAIPELILSYIFCKSSFRYLKINLKKIQWNMLKKLIAFGSANSVLYVANIMRFNIDSFVIAKWIDLPSVAVYGIAAFIVRYFMLFVSRGTQVIFTPRFSSMDGEGRREELQHLFLKSLTIAAYLSFASGSLIIIYGKQFISLWVGEQFINAIPVLIILTISYSIALAQSTGISLMNALKKHYFFAAISLVEGVANFILSIYLAKRFGIMGVAIGTAIPMLVVKLFVQPIYVSRIIKLPLRMYWMRILPPLILSVLIIYISKKLPNISFIMGNEYISLILSSVPFLIIFFLMYYFTNTRQRKVKQTNI